MKRIILLAVLLFVLVGFGLAQNTSIAKPEITIEKLQKRVKELEAVKEQLLANLNAVDGAINDCKYWIDELEGKNENKNAPN